MKAREEPVLQPRAVRLLKKRPRLLNDDFRQEFWDSVEDRVVERRKPDTVAEKAVERAFNDIADSAATPVRDRVMRRLENANEGVLKNL